MSLYDVLRQLRNGADEPVQMGIIARGGGLRFCSPDFEARGVKVVSVSPDVLVRYNRALSAWNAVQSELESLPATLRPRKRFPRSSGATTALSQPPSSTVAVRASDDMHEPSRLSRELGYPVILNPEGD